MHRNYRDPLRRSPKMAQAMAYLERLLESSSADPATPRRLPTIKQLAASAGVNPATMAKVIAALVRQGTLIARHGAGVAVVGPGKSVRCGPAERDRRPSWQHLHEVLVSEITCGRFAGGQALPSRKELRGRFGAGAGTVNRALAALVHDGLAERRGRGFSLRTSPASAPRAALVVVTATRNMSQLAHCTNRSPEFWRTLEHECLRCALDLRVVPYAQIVGVEPMDAETRSVLADRGVAGYLVWSHGLRGHMEAIVGALAQYGKPIAVTDEHTGVRISPHAARGAPVAVFLVASDEHAGEDVGRFLTGVGHRRVAFFVRNRYDTWATGRLRGLCAWFATAGLPGAPECFDAAIPEEWGEFRARAVASREYEQVMRRVADAGRAHGGQGTADVQEVGLQLQNYIWDDYAAAYLAPCFRRAARDRDLSAWVCANDEVGRAAMAFLRREGLTPGLDRTIMGFDDEIVSSGMGLTSYNFGVTAQAVACVHAVLQPTSARPGGGVVVHEIPGFIVARSSSGRPR